MAPKGQSRCFNQAAILLDAFDKQKDNDQMLNDLAEVELHADDQ